MPRCPENLDMIVDTLSLCVLVLMCVNVKTKRDTSLSNDMEIDYQSYIY